MSKRGTLEYTCPSHGGWGMVRTAMLMPESCQLFVCPPACGRHGALGAIRQGFKNRLSYLYLEESDIVSGYDNAIIETVGEFLERRKERPKVMVIFVSCLDDLIGTDGDAVIDALSDLYTDIKFCMCHMNPISNDSEEPPLVSLWKSLYHLMEGTGSEMVRKVNVIGSQVPVHEESELHEIMKTLGIQEVCHIGKCTSYEEFRGMGDNCLNIVVTKSAEKAAQNLFAASGMEYIKAPVSYDYSKIEENYKQIFEKLLELNMVTPKDVQAARTVLENKKGEARKAVEQAKELIKKEKIYLDDSAFANPFPVAKFLIEQGFSVDAVYVSELDETEESYRWLIENTETAVKNAHGYLAVKEWQTDTPGIAMGLEAAYMSGSKHILSVFQDEGMYGYYSVIQLMEKLCACYREETDLKEAINIAGLVV